MDICTQVLAIGSLGKTIIVWESAVGETEVVRMPGCDTL